MLPAPDYGEKVPGSLTAQKNGSLAFAVKSVNGAKAYVGSLKTSAGKTERTEKISNNNAGGNNQKLTLFKRGKAMSGAPIISGINQLPNPPIITGITKKKIKIKP